jgi:hypothetical protein
VKENSGNGSTQKTSEVLRDVRVFAVMREQGDRSLVRVLGIVERVVEVAGQEYYADAKRKGHKKCGLGEELLLG